MQGQSGYSILPKRTLESQGLSSDSQWAGTRNVQLWLIHSLASHEFKLNAGIRSIVREEDLGANVGWSRKSGWTFSLQLRTSFDRDPGAKR